MFVLSVQKMTNVAWYVLNQSDLDRGPERSMNAQQCTAKMQGNTWGCDNSGEFDFIEPICAGPAPADAAEFDKVAAMI